MDNVSQWDVKCSTILFNVECLMESRQKLGNSNH